MPMTTNSKKLKQHTHILRATAKGHASRDTAYSFVPVYVCDKCGKEFVCLEDTANVHA